MRNNLYSSVPPETHFPSTGFAADDPEPDYSDTHRDDIPERFKWRISDIYPSIQAWESDFTKLRSNSELLRKLRAGWTDSAGGMLTLLDYVNDQKKRGMKLYLFASHSSHMDLENSDFRQMSGEIQNFLVEFQSSISFVDADILALGELKFQDYLREEPGLEPYSFHIRNVLRMRDHILSAEESRIVSMTGLFAGNFEDAAGLLNNIDIPAPEISLENGETVTINHSRYLRLRASANMADRRHVMRTYWNNHRKFENTLSTILDGGIKHNLFQARVHGYTDCLESRLFPEAIDREVYHSLIRGVRANLAPLHRYLKLRARILKIDALQYEDIYATAVPKVEKQYTFEQARSHVIRSVIPLGPEYVSDLEKAFTRGWIDIYPNKGKQSGAYSSGVYGIHPYVKLNHDGTYASMSTLAHELGHAMHSHYSNRSQHYAKADYSIFLAEIASTFNENLLVHHMLEHEADPGVRISILDGYLERIRATIFRQALFAEFELALHQRVEAGDSLTPSWLNRTYLDLTRTYYGHDLGVVEVKEFIRGEWGSIPHFFYNFYVFQYSTGLIAAMALSKLLLSQGAPVRDSYLRMLHAGGSGYPLEILKDAGVDMTSDSPMEKAIEEFSSLVDTVESLAISKGLI